MAEPTTLTGQTDIIGQDVIRKEAPDKVTGNAQYNTDANEPGLLHAWMVTSLYAHANLTGVDTSAAWQVPGVRAVITGQDCPFLCGPVLEDRPPLALNKVRYFGEPIALVVGDREDIAKRAADQVQVRYEPLPVVHFPGQALQPGAPLIHENLAYYRRVMVDVYPHPWSNIASHTKIRKGDIERGFAESEVIVEGSYALPQSNHVAMEPRNVGVKIMPDGLVVINASTQAPYDIKKMISRYFNMDQSRIAVHVPLVGGAFGGKTTVQLEILGYLASRAVNGRKVKLVETREQDLTTSPGHIGLEAEVKLGATRDGLLKAAHLIFKVDSGAYTDSGPKMAMAMASDCTGPYRIDNVWCDSLCVYTNHSYVTAYRGYGRLSYVFAIERTLDKLALRLGMDPLELRRKNALLPGDTTPTLVRLNQSSIGRLDRCLDRVRELINWDEGMRIDQGGGKITAKGLSCLWKTSSSPQNAVSGVFLTMNLDGTLNLISGAVEFGEGTKTTLAQILAEKLKMDIDQIHVIMDVQTEAAPKHWKTVASMTTYMAGNAVLDAANNLVSQLTNVASIVLRCPPELLEVAGGKVFLKSDPEYSVDIKEIAHGYKYPDGCSIGGQIIGRGSFIMPLLTQMDPETGKGRAGPGWTVGAQAVEVLYNRRDCTYKILKAATVLDAGRILNPKNARGLVMGGMSMGLGYGSREANIYDSGGVRINPQLRTYHLMRFGENPIYRVDFVETPQVDSPYGTRGLGEHGVIGMPAALANALSAAVQADLNQTPLTPEYIWSKRGDLS